MPDHTIFNERPESQDRAIKTLVAMGYQYITRAEAEQKRGHLSRVLFPDTMQAFMGGQGFRHRGQLHPFSGASIKTAIDALDVPLAQGNLSSVGKQIYDAMLYGKSCPETLYDGVQSFNVPYVDWADAKSNIWQVTEEFSVERPNGQYARPDIVLMLNGVPVVVIECKSSQVDVEQGVRQHVRNFQPDYIPQLYKYAQVLIAINPAHVKYGTSGTREPFFCAWQEEYAVWQQDCARRYTGDQTVTEQDKALVSLCSPERLLQLIRFSILYDNGVKKIARYQQFFGIENALHRLKGEDDTAQRGGVIWHTQGSGKSLTMVMLVKRIISDPYFKNPRFVLVCDRVNLIKQLKDNFIHSGLNPSQAATGKGLISLLQNPGETLISTTINKFETAARQRATVDDEKIILLVDEGHRSHTGMFHVAMREVLPHAATIAFTGTPLLKKDRKNTYLTFGKQIGRAYKFEDGIRDGVIVPLVYEGRYIPQNVTSDRINDYLQRLLEPLTEEQREDLRAKWSRFLPIAQTNQRLNMIAFDIHEHFLRYCRPKGLKAMVAASSRASAIELKHAINNMGDVHAEVLICDEHGYENDEASITSSDKQKIAIYFRDEVLPRFGQNYSLYEEYVKDNIIGGEDVDIVIVKDMLLTGFDAPALSVLYVDKSMKEHTLLQAIARVNRVYEGKTFGLIVDYWGLFGKLNQALDIYGDTEAGLDGFNHEDLTGAIQTAQDEKLALEQSHHKLWELFANVNFNQNDPKLWQSYFDETDDALGKQRRKDFYSRLLEFTKLMELAMGSYSLFMLIGREQMEHYKQDLLFFQKLRLSLMEIHSEKVDFSKYEDGIRSLLNNFVTSEPVQILVEPVVITDKQAMDEKLEQIDGQKARAAYIRTRLVSALEASRYEDPLRFKQFSQRIQDTLEEYRKSRDDQAYFLRMQKMSEDFRQGFVGHTYPACIEENNDAKAFYGILEESLIKLSDSQDESFASDIGNLSICINNAIKQNTKVDWRTNRIVHDRINQAMEDLLWEFADDHRISLPMDVLDTLLEDMMRTAMNRY
ncbi:MAG: HsdR family type I site-specific deoxyribonuclease [Candidatus Limiplasma sp.]|nr:HsdR family type I site-specific deoxyribonuclease [Candidatus Limiplasma sp.]